MSNSGSSHHGISIESFERSVAAVLDRQVLGIRSVQPNRNTAGGTANNVPSGFLTGDASTLRMLSHPRLSYGRHRGPARQNSRRAAVVIVVYPHRTNGELCITLTRRPMTLSHHAGQVCLPGGQIESDETPTQAALREYHEELGIKADVRRHLGQLPPMYVFASDNLVDTLIVTADSPESDWVPDPVEVDSVIEMPLAALVELQTLRRKTSTPPSETPNDQIPNVPDQPPETSATASWSPRKRNRSGRNASTGAEFHFDFGYNALEFIDCEGRVSELWGATAMLLDQFAEIVCQAMRQMPPIDHS